MSSPATAPRRSQRDKKPTKPFTTVTATSKKRKHVEIDNDESGGNPPEDEDPEPDNDEDDDDDEDDGAPKRKASRKKTSVAKKPRATKAPATRKPRKGKADDALFDPEKLAKDTKIKSDNPLFNAIINPAAALQSTAEDFLESLDQDAGTAQAELINLILRCCGSNDTVNSDEAVDYDGVVDTLDNFTESLKKYDSPTYPLTSKLAAFKKFRTHLSEFISRLIASAAELGSLYTSDLVTTLTTWVVAMSSSQIRSFRHTATVIALESQAALCDVARGVEKEVEVVGRQREGEKKRRTKGANKDKGLTAREKELEAKSKEVNSRKQKLEEYISEFVDAVFVHRYRDLDPLIRTECITSLGVYFKKFPSHFLNNSYLRYVGWVLSDAATAVRLAAVKSLGTVYSLSTSSGEADHALTSLNHFTERFKPRLLDMAEGDTDVGVRVGVLSVLVEIDKAGLLGEQERERLGALIFSEDLKVRKGVAPFVKGVWEEWCEERMNEHGDSTAPSKGKKNKDKESLDRDRVGIKGLAALLVKWADATDKIIGDDEESDDGVDQDTFKKVSRLAAFVAPAQSRIALAVDALWDRVDPASDWEGILDMLLLDHSAVDEENPSPSRTRRPKGKPNGKRRTDEDDDDDTQSVQVEEAWRLDEVEEGVLLEVLVASIQRAAKEAAAATKKGEEDDVVNDITRALIKALPRLFIKYQTDAKRIVQVLVLPTFMNLDLYLEMRMLNGYASLWDDVIKQFATHSSQDVLGLACRTISIFMRTAALSNTNSTKILELEDHLSSSLRDAVGGRDEIEVTSFTDDEIHSLAAISLRLQELSGIRDMTGWVEDNESGKQSSAWDILSAIAERGRLGYKEEEAMVENTLRFLYIHIMWKLKGVNPSTSPSAEETRYQEVLKEQRDSLMEKLNEYAIGTQSNTAEGVKRTAFKCLIDLYVLFASWQKVNADGSLMVTASVPLVMDDEVQYRCAGYIQAEIEGYVETFESAKDKEENPSDEEGSDDEEAANKRRKDKDTDETENEVDMTSRTRLEQEYDFIDVVSTFLRAIHAGVIHLRHGGVLLAHYGRLGNAFDACLKVIVEVLRDDGVINKQEELVVSIITQALQDAFTLVLEDSVHDESSAQQLAKLLATTFVVRGSQLAVVRRLGSEHVVNIQLTLLTWIGKRMSEYQRNGRKRSMKKAILFFRVLVPLLSTIQSRDGLKIKAHLDQILAQAKVEVFASAVWEPYRSYEKRLNTVMTKDKAVGSKGRKGKSAKATAGSETEGEETEVEKLVGDDLDEPPPPPPKRTPRPRRTAQPAQVDSSPQSAISEPVTPKPRPKPRPYRAKNKSPAKSAHDQASPSKSSQQPFSPIAANGFVTPKSSRKRGRSEIEEDEAADVLHPSSPEAEPDVIIRRKRIRY